MGQTPSHVGKLELDHTHYPRADSVVLLPPLQRQATPERGVMRPLEGGLHPFPMISGVKHKPLWSSLILHSSPLLTQLSTSNSSDNMHPTDRQEK